MAAQLLEHLLRQLVGHQPEIHFGGGAGGQHGLRAGTLVAGGQSTDGASRLEHLGDLQLRPAGQTFEEMVDPVALFVFIRDFGQGGDQLPVAGAGWLDRVIKAGQADAFIRTFQAV